MGLVVCFRCSKINLGNNDSAASCDKVETIQGVPLNVTGVAQVKIMKNPELLKEAAEQFLGKNIREIHYAVLQTLEGHLRAILGTLTVEEIYKDREAFATQVDLTNHDTRAQLSRG